MRSFARPRREVSDDVDSARPSTPAKPVRRPTAALAARRGGSLVAFFRSIAGELRKVTWPTREETQRLTSLVVAVSLAVGLSLGGIDFFFTKLVNALLNLGR